MDKLILAVFTDGTWNDVLRTSYAGDATNIAKLHKLWAEGREPGTVRAKHYVVGVGTGGTLDSLIGGLTGNGFMDRVDQAMRWIWEMAEQNPGDIEVQLFGFSRGAAESLHLVNLLTDPASLARFRLTGRNLRVTFVGLFDPVASLGIPGNGIDKGARLRLRPSQARKVVSLVARFEVRPLFDLQSLRVELDPERADESIRAGDWDKFRKSHPLPSPDWEEWLLPGMHSDIGGGYEPQEWIPDLPPLEPLPGETLEDHLWRAKDQELEAGAAPRGLTGNSAWPKEQVAERIRAIHEERLRAWERPRLEDAAGNHGFGGQPGTRQKPVLPGIRSRSNELSKIALWVMIRRAEKSGVKWKTLSELDASIRPGFERLPPQHPLYCLQALDLYPTDLEKQVRLDAERYWRDVIPCIHDSRLATDLGQRAREVYCRGRKD